MNIIMTLLISMISVFVVGSLTGYFAHWLMHTKLFQPLAKSHNVHHELYTFDDYFSEEYRSSGKDTSTFVFVPVILISVLLLSVGLWFIFNAWWVYPIILLEGILLGTLNDRMHDWFHQTDHWLNKYQWFKRLNHLHWLHHVHPDKNMGIIFYFPDKLFGTFIE